MKSPSWWMAAEDNYGGENKSANAVELSARWLEYLNGGHSEIISYNS